MTFDADAASVEDSLPREGIEIRHGAIVYRIALGTRSRLINGSLFTALPADRSDYGVATVTDPRELSIRLPVSHPFTQRYVANGIPPKRIALDVWQTQLRSGETKRIWSGRITSCKIGHDHVANFLAPSLIGETLQRPIPSLTVGKTCAHILYEDGCLVSRGPFSLLTTVQAHNGRVITVGSIAGNPDDWATFGELLHVPTGERMTIQDQVGNVITMQLPIYELGDNDAVQIFAGCDHLINTCEIKFLNRQRFGGMPHLPNGNIFLPNGYGIYQSG